MKKIKFQRIIFLLFIVFISTSCSKNNEQIDNLVKDQIENNINKDTWSISYYYDSDKDETHHFSTYSFVFKTTNEIVASSISTAFNGIWSISDSNSSDDSQDDLHFNIAFNVGNKLDDLSDDWDFISQSPTKIELIDVSGGNGGIDYLTFKKN